jgi:hypothetical protein
MSPLLLHAARWLCAAAFALASTSAWTGALTVIVDDLGGGLFQYNLTLSDPFSEPISGLNLLHGGSAFGLDDTSVIGAPAAWDFFPPLPPLVDELNYFSLDPATDVPIGGSLSGFFFRSSADPATLPADAFAFDVIGANSGAQLAEPDLLALVALGGLIALGFVRAGRPRWRRA